MKTSMTFRFAPILVVVFLVFGSSITNAEPQVNTQNNVVGQSDDSKKDIKQKQDEKQNSGIQEKKRKTIMDQLKGEDNENIFFALGCGIASIVVHIIKYIAENIKDGTSAKESLIAVQAKSGDLAGWTLAAALVGLIASAIELLAPSLVSTIAVALSWPSIWEKIMKTVQESH